MEKWERPEKRYELHEITMRLMKVSTNETIILLPIITYMNAKIEHTEIVK